jgi:hypothetical protein
VKENFLQELERIGMCITQQPWEMASQRTFSSPNSYFCFFHFEKLSFMSFVPSEVLRFTQISEFVNFVAIFIGRVTKGPKTLISGGANQSTQPSLIRTDARNTEFPHSLFSTVLLPIILSNCVRVHWLP